MSNKLTSKQLNRITDKCPPECKCDRQLLHNHITALESERERLLNLVRYCRHELLDKELITQDEFASILEEGSAAKLETYDQLRGQITALEQELKAARDEVQRADDKIVERAAQLSAKIVIDDAIESFRAGLIAAVRDECQSGQINFMLSHDIIQLITTFEVNADG